MFKGKKFARIAGTLGNALYFMNMHESALA